MSSSRACRASLVSDPTAGDDEVDDDDIMPPPPPTGPGLGRDGGTLAGDTREGPGIGGYG